MTAKIVFIFGKIILKTDVEWGSHGFVTGLGGFGFIGYEAAAERRWPARIIPSGPLKANF